MTVPCRLTTITPGAVAFGLVAALLLSAASPFVDRVAADTVASTDHSSRVTTAEVASTLRHSAGVLQDSSTVTGTSDSDTALETDSNGASVRVHKHARDGVTLASSSGQSLAITLPGANQSGDGQQVAPGVVAYSSNNGSANAVQAEADGSVRMLTVIDSASAPTSFDYGVGVPEGGGIQLQDDGSAVVTDEKGEVAMTVAMPWATDANGKYVKTWFTTDGSKLVQHVKHRTRGVAYPVTADPNVSFGWNVYVNFSKSETDSFKKYQEAGYSAWALSALICGKIPNPAAQIACGAVTVVKGYQLNWAVRNASESNNCLQMSMPYVALGNPSLAPTMAWFGWARC